MWLFFVPTMHHIFLIAKDTSKKAVFHHTCLFPNVGAGSSQDRFENWPCKELPLVCLSLSLKGH